MCVCVRLSKWNAIFDLSHLLFPTGKKYEISIRLLFLCYNDGNIDYMSCTVSRSLVTSPSLTSPCRLINEGSSVFRQCKCLIKILFGNPENEKIIKSTWAHSFYSAKQLHANKCSSNLDIHVWKRLFFSSFFPVHCHCARSEREHLIGKIHLKRAISVIGHINNCRRM